MFHTATFLSKTENIFTIFMKTQWLMSIICKSWESATTPNKSYCPTRQMDLEHTSELQEHYLLSVTSKIHE